MKYGQEFIRYRNSYLPVGHGTHYWNGEQIVRKNEDKLFYRHLILFCAAGIGIYVAIVAALLIAGVA